MKELEDSHDYTFDYNETSSKSIVLPRLPVKFKSESWSVHVAKRWLRQVFHSWGFGRGKGQIRYRQIENRPRGWPDALDFTQFNISYFKRVPANEIAESFIRFYTYSEPDE